MTCLPPEPAPPRRRPSRAALLAGLWAAAALVSGCSGLLPVPAPPPRIHTLDRLPATAITAAAAPADGATLAVSLPRAGTGLDGRQMLYAQAPQQLAAFARNEWADTPARMLQPLLVEALERSGGFRAVVALPGAVDAGLRLDTELLRLQQQFDSRPSRLRLTLRARLVDSASRAVLGSRVFDLDVAAASDDPQGGAQAASAAVQLLLPQLAEFCVLAARSAAAPPR